MVGVRGSLLLFVLLGPSLGDEPVTNPRFSLNVLFARFGFELFAQLAHEDAKVLRLLCRLDSPNCSEQCAMGDDLTGMPGQVHEEIKFLRREMKGLSKHLREMRSLVDDKVSGLDFCSGALGRPAQMRANACEKLLNAEGLGYVIVGSRIQRFDLAAFLAAHRQDEYRRRRGFANCAAQIHSAHARHHEVGDDKVRSPLTERAKGLLRVVGGPHIESLRRKCGTQNPCDLRLIVDNQHSFGHPCTSFRASLNHFVGRVSFRRGQTGVSQARKTIMRLTPQPRDLARWFGATLAAVLTTAALISVGAGATTAGMVFLLVAVWTATQAGILISLFGALLCAFSFGYFFLPPIHTFALAGPQEWVSLVTFVASSLVAGRVAERARRQTRHAEQRREDVERLYTLSQEMMHHEEASGLIRELPRRIQQIFGLESAALYVHEHEQFHASGFELTEPFKAAMRALAASRDSAPTFHEGFAAQALMLGLRPVGALAWRPDRLSREVATAVSAQVAIAITRAIAIEANTRLEALRESERLRVALIDSLTHELRTPLTAIRAAATTLIGGEGLDETTRLDLASVVDEEASRLDLLIGEAVEMAEIDAKVVQVNLTAQSIRSLLERAIEEGATMLASHQVVIEVDEPGHPVEFDFNLLRRVFRHLLENSSRYSPRDSRIVLRGRLRDNRLEFSVEDNGPGIDPDDLPMVFEKFYRGKQAGTRGKGSGMGLAIARAIARAHGGDIEVASSPGKGAIFRFWVPFDRGVPGSPAEVIAPDDK